MAKIFRDQKSGETLDQFLNRSVQPTQQEITSFNADIDSFVRFLHSADLPRPYSVDMVLKSGSLGKGTAVRGHADIDLVVFINGIKSIDDLIQNRSVLLQHLTNSIRSYVPWQGRIRIDSTTKFSISCTLNGNQVDILPAFHVSRYLGSPPQIYSAMEMDSRSRRGGVLSTGQEFSASLAQFQLEFVKPVPGHVKEVIRLLKLWKKENGLNIRSYSLELLTVHVWKSLGGGVTGTHKLFKAAMEMLTDFDNIRIAFNYKYTSDQYVRTLRPPYILDPANPYMNTLGGLATSGISDAARRTYQSL